MANHKVVTPYEVVEKGGYYYMESTENERKGCVTYGTANSTWLGYHGIKYQNTTGISYSYNQLLCLDDVTPNVAPPTKVVYQFQNDASYPPYYIRATDIPCCNELSNLNRNNWGGAVVTIEGATGYGYTYYPATAYSGNINTAIDTSMVFMENGVEYYTYNGNRIATSNVLIITADGTIPFDAYDNELHNGATLFRLSEYITLDFNGNNCRNKYFSFFIGQDEQAVQKYAIGQTPTGQFSFGWSAWHLVGYGNKTYLNNGTATHINSKSAGEEKLYDYKSVKHIYTSEKGFTVVFNDTSNTNSIKEEWIVVGYDLDNNTWNTTDKGFIFHCKNFTMS